MKKLLGLTGALGALLVLAACPSPNQSGSSQGGTGAEAGSLTIAIAEQVSSRTLLPSLSMTPASYTINGYHSPTDTFTQTVGPSTTTVTVNKLTFGDWAVTVNAYNADSPPTLIGSGTVTATVQTNASAQADVTVLPLTGTGALALTVAWTGTIEHGTVNGTLSRAGFDPIAFNLSGSGSTYTNSALTAGYYTLALQVLDTGTVVTGAAEKVRVVSGQTTSGTVTFENLTGPGGSLTTSIVVSLQNPLQVAVSRAPATGATAGLLNFAATQSGTSNPVCTWYLNGAPVLASWASGLSVSLPHDWAVGTYRVDALVSNLDGTQAGSASFVFVWLGSLATAPAGVASGAYFNTTNQVPWVWDGAQWQTFYPSLVVSVGPAGQDFSSIQAAINAPFPAGYTVQLGPGEYNGSVDITKRITLEGAGSEATGTVLVNHALQGDFTNLPGVAGITYGVYRPTLVISVSGTAAAPLVIKDLRLGQRENIGYPRPGVLLRPGAAADRIASYSYITLDNVQMVGHTGDDTPGSAGPPVVNPSSANEWGFAVDGRTSVDHLTFTRCRFTDMIYGVILFNATPSPSTALNVDVIDSVFEDNSVKGFYAEKLSQSSFTGCSFVDNGRVANAPYYFAATNAGLDLNLKYGTYTNLTFTNLTVTGNGLGSYAGAGLTIKARGTGNDTTYLSTPASLSGVLIQGGNYTGNEVGVRLGEIVSAPPFTSLGLTSPTDVSLQKVSITGNARVQLLNLIGSVTLPDQQTSYP